MELASEVGLWLGIRLCSKSKYFTMASLFVLEKQLEFFDMAFGLPWAIIPGEAEPSAAERPSAGSVFIWILGDSQVHKGPQIYAMKPASLWEDRQTCAFIVKWVKFPIKSETDYLLSRLTLNVLMKKNSCDNFL